MLRRHSFVDPTACIYGTIYILVGVFKYYGQVLRCIYLLENRGGCHTGYQTCKLTKYANESRLTLHCDTFALTLLGGRSVYEEQRGAITTTYKVTILLSVITP